MDNTSISKEDYRFYVDKPDPNFSPERNKAIIQETIVNTTKFFKTKNKAIQDSLGERVDILASYANHTLAGKNETKTLEQYLGRHLYTQIVGEKILQKVRLLKEADKLAGTKTKKFTF